MLSYMEYVFRIYSNPHPHSAEKGYVMVRILKADYFKTFYREFSPSILCKGMRRERQSHGFSSKKFFFPKNISNYGPCLFKIRGRCIGLGQVSMNDPDLWISLIRVKQNIYQLSCKLHSRIMCLCVSIFSNL
jgi:hypothetical protein